ncbi:MAG: hypothetical protein P8K77_03470 [Polaribacter sp.]|nr:hypothetical protein [Polaribacter sp.]
MKRTLCIVACSLCALLIFSCVNNTWVETPENLIQKYSIEHYEFSKEKVDSLEQKLSVELLRDTLAKEVIPIINELLIQYKSHSPKKALSLTPHIHALYRSYPDSSELPYSFQLIGHVFQELGLYEKAKNHYFVGHDLSDRIRDFKYRNFISLNIGDVYFNQGYYKVALDHYMDSFTGFKEWELNSGLAYCSMKIALTYMKLERLGNAEEYVKKAIQYSATKQFSFPKRVAIKSLEAALLMKTNQQEKAAILIEALEKSAQGSNRLELGNLYKLLGDISTENKDTLAGTDYYQKSYKIFTQLPYPKKRVQLQLKIAEYASSFQNTPKQALGTLKEALQLVEEE